MWQTVSLQWMPVTVLNPQNKPTGEWDHCDHGEENMHICSKCGNTLGSSQTPNRSSPIQHPLVMAAHTVNSKVKTGVLLQSVGARGGGGCFHPPRGTVDLESVSRERGPFYSFLLHSPVSRKSQWPGSDPPTCLGLSIRSIGIWPSLAIAHHQLAPSVSKMFPPPAPTSPTLTHCT